MCQDTTNVNFSTIEMDSSNQPILVATDIKHSKIINKIYAWKYCAQFGKIPERVFGNKFKPTSKWHLAVGISFPEFAQCPFANNVHLFPKIMPQRIAVCRGHPSCLGVYNVADVRPHPLRFVLGQAQSALRLDQRCCAGSRCLPQGQTAGYRH